MPDFVAPNMPNHARRINVNSESCNSTPCTQRGATTLCTQTVCTGTAGLGAWRPVLSKIGYCLNVMCSPVPDTPPLFPRDSVTRVRPASPGFRCPVRLSCKRRKTECGQRDFRLSPAGPGRQVFSSDGATVVWLNPVRFRIMPGDFACFEGGAGSHISRKTLHD